MEKQYWLNLKSNTFLWIDEHEGLFYNSDSKNSHRFELDNQTQSWCTELLNVDNLYSILVNSEDYETYSDWFNLIETLQFGHLIPQSDVVHKPISYPPIIYIEEKIDESFSIKDSEFLKYLHELVFYLSGTASGAPDYYKQVLYPLQSAKSLLVSDVISFIDKAEGYNLQTLYFLGLENLCKSDIDILCARLALFPYKIVFITLSENLSFYASLFKRYPKDNVEVRVFCDTVVQVGMVSDAIKSIDQVMTKICLTVKSEMDCEVPDQLLNLITLVPIYDRTNLDFFESSVAITEEDRHEFVLSKQEIFRNQVLNHNYFGRLTILPDRSVYADVNDLPVGTLSSDIYDCIYSAMQKDHAWMRLRNCMPCVECVYKWLCPPLSNYEKVIGRPNLCDKVYRK